MKLSSLHSRSQKRDVEVLREYLEKLQTLQFKYGRRRVLNEAKITITIDDAGAKTEPQVVNHHYGSGIPESAKSQFIEQAKTIGNFGDAEWVEQLIRGMKQAGVQGFNEITEEEKPVSQKDMRQLIGLLVNLLNSN